MMHGTALTILIRFAMQLLQHYCYAYTKTMKCECIVTIQAFKFKTLQMCLLCSSLEEAVVIYRDLSK